MDNADFTNENDPAAIAARFINSTQRSIFLTGKAGTGKTTFLRNIVRNTYKNTVIVAPTGIAAINAGGVTIHSLFQLPFGPFVPSNEKTGAGDSFRVNTPASIFKDMQLSKQKRKLLNEIELLIIDEVSMLRADILDAIDTVLKSVRRSQYLPFGGVQVLFIGDLQQLPPVVKEDEWRILRDFYSGIFFFEAKILKQFPPLYIELDKIYRQSDDRFISLLNNLRNNTVSREDIELLNQYYKAGFNADPKDNYIQLTTHNYKADAINREALKQLGGKTWTYEALVADEFNESAFPIDKKLELKKGAQVMFIKNDLSGAQKFFNGKIGKVASLSNDAIEVYFEEEDRTISVDQYTWENIRYSVNENSGTVEEKTIGTFKQFPIKLAWAITVHKSQGLTFQKAIIDIGDAFAPGQVYVALSRLTSLDGLILSSKIDLRSLSQDELVNAYSKNRSEPEQLHGVLESEGKKFVETYAIQCFSFNALTFAFKQHLESYSEGEHSARQKHFGWAQKLHEEFEPTKTFSEKFIQQIRQIAATDPVDSKAVLHGRVIAAKEYFTPLLKKLSAAVHAHADKVQKEKRVKQYLTDLGELDAAILKQVQQIAKAETVLHAVLNKTDPTKEQLVQAVTKATEEVRINPEDKAAAKKAARKKKAPAEKAKKEVKPASHALSFDLFSQGKTVAEIAAERKMAATTIEGHLAFYVTQGMLDASQFVSAEKQEKIIAASRELDTVFLSPIREHLGDDFTFTEIKFALASEWAKKA